MWQQVDYTTPVIVHKAMFSPYRVNTTDVGGCDFFFTYNTSVKAATHEFMDSLHSDSGVMVLWFGCPSWVPVFQCLLPSWWYYFEKL